MKLNLLLIILVIIALTSTSQDFVVYFDFDKTDLYMQQITCIDNKIKLYKTKRITLFGYADTIGTLKYNRELVQRRLETVKSQILETDSTFDIISINYGEENSKSPINQENRKVVIESEFQNYFARIPNFNKPELFIVDNIKDTLIKCIKGTSIYIPKNSFILEGGRSAPNDIIRFYVTEYYDPAEMIDANLTTQSNGDILETGGMLNIEAYSDTDLCSLGNGKFIGIGFANRTDYDSMRLFYGVPENETINWLPSEDLML